MAIEINLATWNIGGGILGESHQLNGRPEIDYHAKVINHYQPDIICLHKAHEYSTGQTGQAQQIADMTGYDYVHATAISPSHLEDSASLSLGILSRFPIESHEYKKFPTLSCPQSGLTANIGPFSTKALSRLVSISTDNTLNSLTRIAFHCVTLAHRLLSPDSRRSIGCYAMAY